MKFVESERGAKRRDVTLRLVIARQYPQLVAQAFQDLTAGIETLGPVHEVTSTDVDISLHRRCLGQSTQIAVNVGEDLNSHASISVIIPSHLLVG